MRFINVPSVNTGKKITSIKYRKEVVVVKFSDQSKLEIPHDIYTSYYLYENKVLSEDKIDEITLKINTYKLLKYARNLLIKHAYTEKKIREKLYAKEATKAEVDEVIKQLKSARLIDDKSYVEEYVNVATKQGLGKNKIIAKLKEKGIFSENFTGLYFSDEEELKRARGWIKKLEKRYMKYPYNSRKQHIISALVNQGFDIDIASEATSEMSKIDEKYEYELIKIEFKKVYEKYKSKYEGYELRNKIYSSLISKGYMNRDVIKILEVNRL